MPKLSFLTKPLFKNKLNSCFVYFVSIVSVACLTVSVFFFNNYNNSYNNKQGQVLWASSYLEPGLQERNDIVFFEGYEELNWKDNWDEIWRSSYKIRKTDPNEVFDGNASLYIYCPREYYGSGQYNNGGGEKFLYLDNAYGELYLRLYMKIATDEYYDIPINLKNAGLYGYPEGAGHCCCDPCGSGCSSCVPADGTNKFSAKGCIAANLGGPHIYSYHPFQEIYGGRNFYQPYYYSYESGEIIKEEKFGSATRLLPDQWYSIEVFIKVNDLGQNNAEMKLWVDGNLKAEVTNWKLRNENMVDMLVREISCNYGFNIYEDGNTLPYIERWEDNLVAAKHYIGPMSTDIGVNHAPQVDAQANLAGNKQVNFTATASDDDGTVEKYLWHFGDGTETESQNPNHNYSTNGTYEILVEALDNDGAIGWKILTVTVEDEDSPPPNPSASPTPTPPTNIYDLNNDGTVDVLDLMILLTSWGATDPTTDVNDDGVVNGLDFVVLVQNFTPQASPSPSPQPNLISNPGFESGTSPWYWYLDGTKSFETVSPGYGGTSYAAKLSIPTQGSNVQFYQANVALEPNTNYSLSFAAYSNTGNDLRVDLLKHTELYDNYGLSQEFNLTSSWQVFETSFTTNSSASSDARFRFWLAEDDATGDIYWIDGIELYKQ